MKLNTYRQGKRLVAVAYVRYSSHNQDDGFSIEYQVAEINAYAEKHDIYIEKIYIDQALTATKVVGREQFLEMLGAATNGKVDVIIVYKMNRMFRDSEESHVYRKHFRKHGVKIISVTEPIDEETSAGRFMANTLASLDQYQSEIISDHVKSSMREMARQGYFTGGPVPFGFKLEEIQHGIKVRKKLVVCEEEAFYVRKMYELFNANYTLRYIQIYLKDNGINTRRGKPFIPTSISRMLSSRLYLGELIYKSPNMEDIVVTDAVEPIVDLALWESVQERKAKNKEKYHINGRWGKNIYCLTGLLYCGKCNAHFHGVSSASTHNGKRYEKLYYYCSNKQSYNACDCANIRKDYIEPIVLRELKNRILNENDIKQIAAEAVSIFGMNSNELEAQIKEFEKHKKTLDENLSELVRMRFAKELSPERLKLEGEKLEAELKEVNEVIAKLNNIKETTISNEEVEEYLTAMLNKLDENNDEIIKMLFQNFVEKVIINDDSIEVRLFVRPHATGSYNEANGQGNVRLYANISK